MSVLEIKNLSIKYNENELFENLSFKLEEGKSIGLIGPSGSGKSSIIKSVLGLIKPHNGDIIVNNTVITDLSTIKSAEYRLNNIGMIFQDYCLLDHLTARENIALLETFNKKPVNYQKVSEAAKSMNIEHKLDSVVSTLSGGEKQRIAILRAIAQDVNFIVADEPTGALDKNMTIEVTKILFDTLKKYNIALCIVSHDETVYMHCDELIDLGSLSSK